MMLMLLMVVVVMFSSLSGNCCCCQVLSRETGWVNWKKEQCPSFEKAPVAALPSADAAATRLLTAPSSGGDAAAGGGPPAAKRVRRFAASAAAADAAPTFEQLLLTPPDNYAGLQNAERGELSIPSLREVVDQVRCLSSQLSVTYPSQAQTGRNGTVSFTSPK